MKQIELSQGKVALVDLGTYGTPEEAAHAYNEAAQEYNGAFAQVNSKFAG